MSKTAAVRTPGEDAPTTEDVIEGAEAAGLDVIDATKPRGKKLTLEERMDMLEEENRLLRANQMPAAPAKVDPYADCPDISEFTGKNQHKQNDLTAAILTKQGWIAPAHLGANPAALNELQKRGLAATSVK